MSTADPRISAFRCIERVLNGQTLDHAFDQCAAGLDARDRGFAREVASGVVRHYFSLSADIGRFLSRPIAQLDTAVLVVLLIGAYQLRRMRVPGFAAVNETVELARRTSARAAGGMVNAVLRKVAASAPPADTDDEARFDHPLWLIEALRGAYPGSWESLLAVSLERAPMSLRVNAARTDRDTYLAALAAAGIGAQASPLTALGIRLDAPVDVASLPGFADGLCTVQDEHAQLAVELLAIEPGHRVLDACAAPGNKTSQILEHTAARNVVALDPQPVRVETLRRQLARLGHSLRVAVADARDVEAWWDDVPFDRVLLDAPCSGTGTLRRHPDIKLLRDPDDVLRLASIQFELLTAVWDVLAPGGLLVYSTCSILPQENEHIVRRFLKARPDASLDTGIEPNPRTLLPVQGGADGFFMARLRRR